MAAWNGPRGIDLGGPDPLGAEFLVDAGEIVEASSVGAFAVQVFPGDVIASPLPTQNGSGAGDSEPLVTAGNGPQDGNINGPVYSDMNIGTGWVWFGYLTGEIGWEDYNSTNDANINLTEIEFIGGVETANTSLTFNFWNTSRVLQASTTFTLSHAGHYQWTLTLGSAITVPDQGLSYGLMRNPAITVHGT